MDISEADKPVGACYPILAFVFAKVLDVFQIQDHHDMIKKGDFYALMFFVMALAILLIYGILGWLTNIIATVGRMCQYSNTRH